MPDGTVYFGEIAYVPKDHAQGDAIYYSLEDVPVSTNAEGEHEKPESKVNMVRHGNGIQLYGRNPEVGDKLCFYAGKWDKDLKSGEGATMIYPDGVSSYQGSYKAGVINGNGTLNIKCTSEDGAHNGKHSYTGGFRDGKLEGQGQFDHGLTKMRFGPNFQNNHFTSTGGAFTKGTTHL